MVCLCVCPNGELDPFFLFRVGFPKKRHRKNGTRNNQNPYGCFSNSKPWVSFWLPYQKVAFPTMSRNTRKNIKVLTSAKWVEHPLAQVHLRMPCHWDCHHPCSSKSPSPKRGYIVILWMDEIHFAPSKKLWDSIGGWYLRPSTA